MKEKIAEIIRKPLMAYHPQVGMTMVVIDKGIAEDMITQILPPLKEEIKKSLLTEEEIIEAENQFMEKAKSKHTELGRKFISKEIMYDEYNKQSMEAWAGYYREIAQAQLDKILKALGS